MRTVLSDPMLRLLALAIALAAILPVSDDQAGTAQSVTNVGIFLLFLLNGIRVPRSEIVRGLRNARYIVALIVWVFGAMALIGLGLQAAVSAYLPSLMAVGFLFLGVLPSTVQSATSYSMLAEGNVGLSVVSAALLNILGVFVSVPLFLLLGGSGEGGVSFDVIRKIALMLLFPFVIGQVAQGFAGKWVARHKSSAIWLDRLVIALAVYVAFSGAVRQGIWSRLERPDWAVLLLGVCAFLALAKGGAWAASGALGLPARDRTSFLFAGAQKSAAVGVPLATILFAPDAAGFVVLPLLLYHLFQLVLAAPVANRLAKQSRLRDLPGCSGPTTRS